MDAQSTSYENGNAPRSPSISNEVMPNIYSIRTPYASSTQSPTGLTSRVPISLIKSPISKRHLSFIRPVLSFVVTYAVFVILLLIIGVPPLYASSQANSYTYVWVMVPITSFAASVAHFFIIQQPLHKLNLLLIEISTEANHHRSAIDALLPQEDSSDFAVPMQSSLRSPRRNGRLLSCHASAQSLEGHDFNNSRRSTHRYMNSTSSQTNNYNNTNDSNNHVTMHRGFSNLGHQYINNFSLASHSRRVSGIVHHGMADPACQNRTDAAETQQQLRNVIKWMAAQLQKIEKINRSPLHPEVRMQQRALYSFIQSMLAIQQSLTLMQTRQAVMCNYTLTDDAADPPLCGFRPIYDGDLQTTTTSNNHHYHKQAMNTVTMEGRESTMEGCPTLIEFRDKQKQQHDQQPLGDQQSYLFHSSTNVEDVVCKPNDPLSNQGVIDILRDATKHDACTTAASVASAAVGRAPVSEKAVRSNLVRSLSTQTLDGGLVATAALSETFGDADVAYSAPTATPAASEQSSVPRERLQVYSPETVPLSEQTDKSTPNTQTSNSTHTQFQTQSQQPMRQANDESMAGSVGHDKLAGSGQSVVATQRQQRKPREDENTQQQECTREVCSDSLRIGRHLSETHRPLCASHSSLPSTPTGRAPISGNPSNAPNHKKDGNANSNNNYSSDSNKSSKEVREDASTNVTKSRKQTTKNGWSMMNSSMTSHGSIPGMLGKRNSKQFINVSSLDVPTPVLQTPPGPAPNSNNTNTRDVEHGRTFVTKNNGSTESVFTVMRSLTLNNSPMPKRVGTSEYPCSQQQERQQQLLSPPLQRMITLSPANRLMPLHQISMSSSHNDKATTSLSLNYNIFFCVDVVRILSNSDGTHSNASSAGNCVQQSQLYAFEANVLSSPSGLARGSDKYSNSDWTHASSSSPFFCIHNGQPYRVFRVECNDQDQQLGTGSLAASSAQHRSITRRALSALEQKQLDFVRCTVEQNVDGASSDGTREDRMSADDSSSVDDTKNNEHSQVSDDRQPPTLRKDAMQSQHVDPQSNSNNNKVNSNGRGDTVAVLSNEGVTTNNTSVAAYSSPILLSSAIDDTVYSEPDLSQIQRDMHSRESHVQHNDRQKQQQTLPSAASYILSWAVMPSRPMRLTFLTTKLVTEVVSEKENTDTNSTSNTRSSSTATAVLPVLECLVNNVYSVLSSARVTLVRAANEQNGREVVQSVELFATSIEEDDEGEDDSGCQGQVRTHADDLSSWNLAHNSRPTPPRSVTFGGQVTECRRRRN